jgi:WD40 repeat-containing protein SMU1
VNSAAYSKDGTQVISASSDGTIRLWDIRTSDCLISYRPGLSSTSAISSEATVLSVQLMPNNSDQIVVGIKGPQAFIMSLQGQLLRTLSSGKQTGGDFVSVCVSPQGKWVYCMGEDGILYIFDSLTGQLENVLEISTVAGGAGVPGGDVIGVSHHPHRNLLASITDDGTLKTWKP